ncbi:TetR/AcrR family transcriptional regulator [Nocardia niigatensis]|uniref:TetR/AcrR family transcriptional regulator n=1 Tax=Nocardia niigatensis TaxID=209249 RepID=UPI000310598A|nr:TetR/AcrR family transcriptional regulator [Nocardia niigatensis]
MGGQVMSGTVVAGRSTKDAIRDAALQLFSTKGFDHSSLREVADAVGITKASLYYHYASKVDLLVAIIEPMFEEVRDQVEGLDDIPHTPENVAEVIRRRLHSTLANRQVGVLCMRDTVAIVNALGNRYPDMIELHHRMCRWMAGPDADDDTLLRAAAAMQVLSTAMMSQEIVPAADADHIETTLLNAALGVLNPAR